MGTWGPGLYSSDIALDLKSTIAAVAKLPFDGSRLVEIVSETFPEAATDQADEDYTTFWLVLADQLHRQGIDSRDVFARALDIIDSGIDLRLAAELGMGGSDLRKRAKNLQILREKLERPVPQKLRKVLREPQPLLMAVGDVVVYPIDAEGRCANPFISKADEAQVGWEPADWARARSSGERFSSRSPRASVRLIFLNRRMRRARRRESNRSSSRHELQASSAFKFDVHSCRFSSCQ